MNKTETSTINLTRIAAAIGKKLGRTLKRGTDGPQNAPTFVQIAKIIRDEGEDNFNQLTAKGINKLASDFAKLIPAAVAECHKPYLPYAVDCCECAHDEESGIYLRRVRAFDVVSQGWIHRIDIMVS